jgi:hypothetical protein
MCRKESPMHAQAATLWPEQLPPASRRSIIPLQCSHLFTGGIMGRILLAAFILLLAASCAAPLFAQGAPPESPAGQPYAVEYYYKVQWGHQEEFLNLFLKNHYPLLKKIQATGRILSLKIDSPAYHTTEDGRWDYRVTIVYKDSTVATTANPDEEAFIQQLWPDQNTYKREEQRRFEILAAHWDLPVTDITPR